MEVEIYDDGESIIICSEGTVRQPKLQGIESIISQMPFTDDIKKRSDAIFFSKFQKPVRGLNRVAIAFLCVYIALKEVGESCDLKQLSKLFKLDQRRVAGVLKDNTALIPNTLASPLELLPYFLSKLCLDHEVDILNKVGSDILTRSGRCFINVKPRNIALAILYYYLQITSRTQPKSVFCNFFTITEPQLNDALKQIISLETFKN